MHQQRMFADTPEAERGQSMPSLHSADVPSHVHEVKATGGNLAGANKASSGAEPAALPVRSLAPPEELTAAFRQWTAGMAKLRALASDLCNRYPDDRQARFLLAEVLHGSGTDDLSRVEFEKLLANCPANEKHRVQQGLQQVQADHDYFPADFAERLAAREYATGPNAAVWRDYAWREIQRGREIVRMLRQVTHLHGKRVLDVGSGYGGMLICMAEQGAEVIGVEIDPERAHIGQHRIAALGMQIPYHHDDICKEEVCAGLGRFDVIVCQDVLEHVLDPTRVIRSLCFMLQPGGVIYVQIPNKYGIDQLLSDHHYGLTGITALSRPQAIEYFCLATGENPETYGVGYERGEKYYTAAFARCGVKLRHVERYPSVNHVVWFADGVSKMCTRLGQEIYAGLRPELQKRILRRMTRVAQLYAHASQQIISLQNQPELLEAACDVVVRRLCLPLWRFVGLKPADKAESA